jgi:hypothetical protein
MLRFCDPGRHYVLDGDAQVLRVEATGPTTGRRVYACHQHVRDEGLLPAAAFIGHRDLPPDFADQEDT